MKWVVKLQIVPKEKIVKSQKYTKNGEGKNFLCIFKAVFSSQVSSVYSYTPLPLFVTLYGGHSVQGGLFP